MGVLYLVRHTSVSIDKGICYGQSDVPVSDLFSEEVSLIRNKLGKVEFDKVYSSPLSRCLLLAESLVGNDVFINTDDRIIEMNFGEWEMMKWDDINREEMDKWGNDFVNVACPRGESYLDLFRRSLDFYNEVSHKDKTCCNVLVVTHSGVIRSIISSIRGVELIKSFEFDIPYGGVFKVNF